MFGSILEDSLFFLGGGGTHAVNFQICVQRWSVFRNTLKDSLFVGVGGHGVNFQICV